MPDREPVPGSPRELLHILDVQPTGDLTFVGRPAAHPDNEYSVYGGQLIAQSLRAAWRTVAAPAAPHSIHASFFRPAPTHRPLEFDVSVERDGRTVSSRVVRTRESGKQFCSMTVSFMPPADGPDFQLPMPDVPSPEALPVVDRGERQGREPFEFRWVTEPHGEVHFADCYWVRVTEALPDDPIVHTSIVAYLSDMGVGLGDEIRALDASASSAPSIDHSVWFHRRVRADDWLLFDMRPLSASAGRGLYTGSFYDRNGRLAATMIQEVILRYQPGQSPAI